MHNQQHSPALRPPAEIRTIHPLAMKTAMHRDHGGRFGFTRIPLTPGHIQHQDCA
jgi:hypothetical protein